MSSTLLPLVIDQLIDMFAEAVEALEDEKVWVIDGVDDIDLKRRSQIVVGVQLNDPRDQFISEIKMRQTFPYLGARTKEENAIIPISILCWSGDPTTRGRRERAVKFFQACESAHRANNDLDIEHELIDTSFATDFRMVSMKTKEGNGVVLTFEVGYRAHLTPA